MPVTTQGTSKLFEPSRQPATLPVETRRFLLRDYREEDRAGFVSYQTDPRFTLFHTEEELGDQHAQEVFQLFLDWQVQAPRLNYQMAIAARGDAALLGSCGVRMEGCQPREAVFGIELAREYWGRFGYATEVAMALIDWAFAQLPLDALVADTAPGNEVVARLAEWGGFKLERVEEKVWWRLTRADWQAR